MARPPDDDAGEPRLIELINREIGSAGPVTFARFMQHALYEPDLGYYAARSDRPTREGDFLTAPELHPIFGEAVAAQLDEMRVRLGEPTKFTVREYGAGRGTLGQALPARMHYEPLEFADPAPAAPMTGCIVANELLDALPVHRVIRTTEGLRELYVGWRDGHFVEQADELSDRALESWFADRGIVLQAGQRAEVNLAMLDWLAALPAQLHRGYVLIIDYTLPAAELYDPARQAGTLRAFRAHHVSSNFLGGVGRQDLTATVDIDMLERTARRVGLEVLGKTCQAHFLMGCRLEALMESWRERLGEDMQAQLLLRSAVRRLLDPRALGGYSVLVLGKDVPPEPPLSGLSFRLPGRG
jgi:SAM-dependent MidA family methyltransferase